MTKILLEIIGISTAIGLIIMRGNAPDSWLIVVVLCMGFCGVIEAIEKQGGKNDELKK